MTGVTQMMSDVQQRTQARKTIVFRGCSPTPLAHYLKALAILRLIAEQADPTARGCWQGESFVLTTVMSREEVSRFFLEDYIPSPIVAPWNGGSGFSPKDNTKAIEAIEASDASRFQIYRRTIGAARNTREKLQIDEKVDKDSKETLLRACRALLPDEALAWLDAAYILTADGAKYPPLLGTGGNDGRLDFTNNFMQRVLDVVDGGTGLPTPASAGWLEGALFGTTMDSLQRNNAIGQFLPSAAGGNNQSSGFDAPTVFNPWDFVFMIEGALLFAGAAVKKLESSKPGVLSYPFAVRQSGIGYGSASLRDEADSRAEMWLPMWSEPITLSELQVLMSEGRAQVAGRSARNGVDFARAIATLGVDRGLNSFQRYGFQVRNGLAYFATPLGRFQVRRQPQVNLLDAIDPWLDRFIGRAKGDKAPSSAGRAARNLEEAILALTQRNGTRELQAVLVALGACEAAMAKSFKWASDPRSGTTPIPALEEAWLHQANDGSVEFRLAAALASLRCRYKIGGKQRYMPLRGHLTPLLVWEKEKHLKARWAKDPGRDLVWSPGSLAENLTAVLQRRLLLGTQSGHETYTEQATIRASLGDVAAFIEGRVDDDRLTELLRGLLLIDWPAVKARGLEHEPLPLRPDAAYGALKLCFAGTTLKGDIAVPLSPPIVANAASGNGRATTLALRRLRGSGLPPAVDAIHVNGPRLRRLAAALLFPISRRDVDDLCRGVLRTEDQ